MPKYKISRKLLQMAKRIELEDGMQEVAMDAADAAEVDGHVYGYTFAQFYLRIPLFNGQLFESTMGLPAESGVDLSRVS